MKAPIAGPARVPGPPMIQAAIGMIEKSTAKRDKPAKPEKCERKLPAKQPITLPMKSPYNFTRVTFIPEANTA